MSDVLDLATRALLAAELIIEDRGTYCAVCRMSMVEETGYHQYTPHHDAGCSLDAALKALGFPDIASRDEARERLQIVIEY